MKNKKIKETRRSVGNNSTRTHITKQQSKLTLYYYLLLLLIYYYPINSQPKKPQHTTNTLQHTMQKQEARCDIK